MPKKLYRSQNKTIAGVCGGLAEYLNMDPTLVRVLWVLLSFWGPGLIAYIIMACVIPEAPVQPEGWQAATPPPAAYQQPYQPPYQPPYAPPPPPPPPAPPYAPPPPPQEWQAPPAPHVDYTQPAPPEAPPVSPLEPVSPVEPLSPLEPLADEPASE